jgi:hypothetical protein
MQIYRIGREFVRKIVGVLNAVLDASAAVYASTHDSSAPNWEVIPSITLGHYFFCFRFLGRLRFLMFLHLCHYNLHIHHASRSLCPNREAAFTTSYNKCNQKQRMTKSNK